MKKKDFKQNEVKIFLFIFSLIRQQKININFVLKSVDQRTKQSYIKQMLYNNFFRSRRLVFLFLLAALLIILKKYYSTSSINVVSSKSKNAHSFDRTIKERKINKKIIDISDRQPSFKLYAYDGYEASSDRNRAQAKLLDNLKFHDKCQQNPKTIIVDIGASLGMIRNSSFNQNFQ